MLNGIEFKNENIFTKGKLERCFIELTSNTVVLCEDNIVKDTLTKEILDIIEGKHETGGHDYYVTEDNEIPQKEYYTNYLPTSEIGLKCGQRFIFTIEPPQVFRCKEFYDLWFAVRDEENKIKLYPLSVYIGAKELWDKGLDTIYRYIIEGRFSNYLGYGDKSLTDKQIG